VKRKRLTILFAIFLLVEAAALITGLWPFFFRTKTETKPAVRLGIVPEISKKRSIEEWDIFFKRFENEADIKLIPYFASSSEEAVNGLTYGSLDMLCTNPGIYIELKKKINSEAVAYQKLSGEEKEKNRSVLVAKANIRYLSQTKGQKLTFTEKNSLSGYIMPSIYLKGKLQEPPEKWFSSISCTASYKNAIEMLKKNQTDIIAVNFMKYTQIIKDFPELDGTYSIVWMSPVLPASLICMNPANPLANARMLRNFRKVLESSGDERKYNFNSSSMIFAPCEFEYKKELEALEKLFDEYKDNIIAK